MRKIILFYFTLLISIAANAQNFTVNAGANSMISYDENLTPSAGIEMVYLINGISGATIHYQSTNPSVKFYRYTNTAASKIEIPASEVNFNGISYTIINLLDGNGYFAEIGGEPTPAVWIINYSLHRPVFNSITTVDVPGEGCSTLKLIFDKSDDLPFYTKGGIRVNITRKYTLSYTSLKWDDTNNIFKNETITRKDLSFGNELIITNPPLANTIFTITGDQFATQFGAPFQFISDEYEPVKTEAHIYAEQERPNGEITADSLGGSAPAKIYFYGKSNEPTAYYYTWLIYNTTKDTQNPIARFTARDFNYTFNDWGDYKVVLEVANQASSCVSSTEITFKISESNLEVPNFFSPGDSPGINDIFKVKYKSLVKFKGTIFNRWGVKLFEWTDPEKGWDGKYKGKLVNPGVYFYVITAVGSEGRTYKKGGDINILRSK